MTKQQLYDTLKERFQSVLKEYGAENDTLCVSCRALTPKEAIGKTQRKDFPILTGKDVMIQAEYKGAKGQAFTDAPSAFDGTLQEILEMDLSKNPHERSIFIAALNAVMSYLGLCRGTVHCKGEDPEECARHMRKYLEENAAGVKRIALIGYQPALLEMLANSPYEIRVLDLNPENIGQLHYGIPVEDGEKVKQEIWTSYADLILCTGSTLCNGSIVDYLDIRPPVWFYGTSAAGAAPLLGLKRVCFCE